MRNLKVLVQIPCGRLKPIGDNLHYLLKSSLIGGFDVDVHTDMLVMWEC